MVPRVTGGRAPRRLVAGGKAVVLVGFVLSLSYTAGASLRLVSTTLERWALSVAITLVLGAFTAVVVADYVLEAVR